MCTAASVDPSGVVAKHQGGPLRGVGPVLRRDDAHARADLVAEAGRAVAGRAEVSQRIAELTAVGRLRFRGPSRTRTPASAPLSPL